MKTPKMIKKGLRLRKNKRFFGTFAVLVVLVVLISATLAWSSYTEWQKNHTQSNPEAISVSVTEEFIQGSVLSFSKDNAAGTKKEVRVKNISKRNAIVRVKFLESLLPFELDMTDGKGNANLKVYEHKNEELINPLATHTWASGKLFGSDRQDDQGKKIYYKTAAPITKDVAYRGEAYRDSSAYPDELKFFKWTFDPAVYDEPKPAVSDPYWVFDGEYFYYSQVLEGGDTTAIDLLKSVILANVNIPNMYKYALYNIEIEAEGVNPTKTGLETWTSDSNYFEMYAQDPLFNK